ncbi:MAG TPA: phosphate ABC transporter permease subunit PstC, partial [Stellaceae bacterium]|nr:phosphate ABC transporter permease subunit PstC [Stellaceae bacterium]
VMDATVSASALPRNPSIKVGGAKRLERHNGLFRALTLTSAIFVLLTFVGMFAELFRGAWPAFRHFGLDFFITQAWNPVKERFGILAPIGGTLITSALAMLLAVPVGIGIAIFLTEICPRPLRRPVGIAIELLAGIPSIIYGIWGLFVFAPMLQTYVQPFLSDTLGEVPLIGFLFQGPPLGVGMLTAGIILSIMVLPFITSVMRDVFETVPTVLKESAYGIGATTFEVVWNIVLPYTRTGVIGGIMLGLGRALGETMAVTFVIGNAHQFMTSLLAPGTTISATLANEFSEADTPMYLSVMFALGLILSVITLLVLAAAKFMLIRMERQGGT